MTINHVPTGFRLINGSVINQIIDAVNSGSTGTSQIITGAGPVAVKSTDNYIEIANSLTTTVNLPASPGSTQAVAVKDISGCTTYPITVNPLSGNIDGLSSYTMNQQDGESRTFRWNGTNWRII